MELIEVMFGLNINMLNESAEGRKPDEEEYPDAPPPQLKEEGQNDFLAVNLMRCCFNAWYGEDRSTDARKQNDRDRNTATETPRQKHSDRSTVTEAQ